MVTQGRWKMFFLRIVCELKSANLSEQGYKNVLGIGIENRSDEGHIMFSRNGNFRANGLSSPHWISEAKALSDPNGFIPSENVSIV